LSQNAETEASSFCILQTTAADLAIAAMTDSQIIEALGGTVALAELFGLKPSSVSVWKTRGIAWEYRPRVWKLALERDVEVPADFLTQRRTAVRDAA
jgi:hypothetical protein